ncbi:hypothetical protein [Methylobacterium oryzae]|uniref:hypothetical protein n=1 Tax=Methylobacterium oryzae TaxID=334852 RepID=UPI001F438A50|nr:hypothetical protein [Methylobacterium oryzae]UIN38371.1 hypothetical protein LXM90_30785 [Methylobacterium oryzae]
MKNRHIALALCCLLAVPANSIAACAGWVTNHEDAPNGHIEATNKEAPKAAPAQTPRPDQSKLPTGTPEQIRESRNYQVQATFIALNSFVDGGACPNAKFDPVGAATRLSEAKFKTDGLDQAKIKDLADQQLAFYRGMEAKRACDLIFSEFGPTGSAIPDVIVSAGKK